jgi:hypothetical protein
MYDRGHALLVYLLHLEVLGMISGEMMDVEEFQDCVEGVRSVIQNHHLLVEALERLQLVRGRDPVEIAIDLVVYAQEGEFVDQAGRVTEHGVVGHNNLVALSEVVKSSESCRSHDPSVPRRV